MADNAYRGSQRRAYFRLKYPPSSSPRIFIGGIAYAIHDISERGARINNPMRHRMPEDIFSAFVWFHDGEPIKVVARVVRIEPSQIALYFIQGIPYKRILAEQTYIKEANEAPPKK